MKHKYLWLLILSILYFLPRLPYLIIPLQGEEGIFAEIFYYQTPGPNYLLLGRIDGNNLYGPPEHPAMIYEILSHYGLFLNAIVNFSKFNTVALTFLIRLAFSMFQFLIFEIIALFILQRRDNLNILDKVFLLGGLLILAVTPPAMIISTSVQVDGSIGSLLTGFLAISLLGYRLKLYSPRTAYILAFISSFLFGLGKNEWSVALLLALIFTGGYLLITTRKENDIKSYSTPFILLGSIFIGTFVGNLFSFLYDPENYAGGFNVMSRISKVSSFNFLSFGLERLTFTYVHFILLIFIAVIFVRIWKKADYILFFFFIFGAILFFAYFVTSWAIEPRYYAPSLIVFLAAIVVAFSYLPGKKSTILVWVILLVLLFTTYNTIMLNKKNIRLYSQIGFQNNTNIQNAGTPPDCIPIMGMGEVFGNRIDFIGNNLSLADASTLALKHNKVICK